MKKNLTALAIAVAVSGCALGDSGGGEFDYVATSKQTLEDAKLSSVPYPIQWQESTGATVSYKIRRDPLTEKPMIGWDASHGELLAADAYSQCLAEIGGLDDITEFPPSDYPKMSGQGYAMDRVELAISRDPCPMPPRYSKDDEGKVIYPVSWSIEWAWRRTNGQCNIDAISGEMRPAWVLPQKDSDSPLVLFKQWMATQTSFEFTSTTLDPARTKAPAYKWVYLAHINLCFAQRLASLLERAEMLVMTTQEHMLLLGLAHERAQDAMMKLGYLVKIHLKSASVPVTNEEGIAVGAYLWHWINSNSSLKARIAQNFARAVRMVASTSTSFAGYLERQAGARWTSAGSADAFARDWGPHSARSRLLDMIYGGNALGDLWGADDWTTPQWFSPIREQVGDPQVAVLFNLAREVDALRLRALSSGDIDPVSWLETYVETEIGLRVKYCTGSAAECTRANIVAAMPMTTDENKFVLRQNYGVTFEHAKRLMTGLFDAVARFDMLGGDDGLGALGPSQGVFHLTGKHENFSCADHTGELGQWLKLDKTTTMIPYSYSDRADQSVGMASPYYLDWDTLFGTMFSDGDHANFGVVPALAFAREVLFEMGRYGSTDLAMDDATALLPQIERLVGKTTIVQRPSSVDVIMPASATPVPKLVYASGALGRSGVRAAAAAADYSSPAGISRVALDAAAPTDPDMILIGDGASANLRRVTWSPPSGTDRWSTDTSLLLRSTIGTRNSYQFISTRGASWTEPLQRTNTIVTEGWFADLVQRVTAVQDNDWSRPRFDGFGLPTKWVPPADASLMGGSAGEESYQYLLRSAKAAAEDATAAVKTAIDKLTEEARDTEALAQAETKAQSIGTMEQEALCGKTDGCNVEMTERSFAVENPLTVCNGVPPAGKLWCNSGVVYADSLLGTATMPSVVASRMDSPGENFDDSEFVGSELQRVLTRIWNAARMLAQAGRHAVKLSIAAGADVSAAVAAVSAAETANVATIAQFTDLMGKETSSNQSQLAALKLQEQLAETDVENAYGRFTTYCTPIADIVVPNPLFGDIDLRGDFYVGTNVGGGDTNAAAAVRCIDAMKNYGDAENRRNTIVRENSKAIEGLEATSTNDTLIQLLVIASDSANAQLNAARLQGSSRCEQATVQIYALDQTLRQYVGELQSALAELDQLKLKAGQSKAKADLELDISHDTADVITETRRKYRSYDLWRADALLESARRLAVAARRSIEARFVVDLSTLQAEQAFVASPSTWADEIYESDLNAPEVVGLSLAPKIDGTIYPNKLLDYIGNLERFVQGYTMTYPTSVSLPDTEVITLGGPDLSKPSGETGIASLSPDSSGWRFYCADQQAWISHPGVAEYPLTTRVSTACSGKPPALARIGFWLDPWGSMNGAWTRPIYVDRHNVRWRRLAVNLVGTGIRDCSKAADSMSCYTNPYVRFNLVHRGPSWQTSHSGEWRALDIPTANIEGGKALAAEEWLEPVTNSWNMPYVANVARGELFGRPAAGNYELVLEVTPDIRLDRIERVQLLVEQDYWVRQSGGRGVNGTIDSNLPTGTGGSSGVGGTAGAGGTVAAGGTNSGGGSGAGGSPAQGGVAGNAGRSNSGGSAGAAGTAGSGGTLTGACVANSSAMTIDAFEDGNKIISSACQRLGVWYGFHAGTCTANPATNDAFLPQQPGNASTWAAYTSGTTCNAGDWQGGGIGFTFLSALNGTVETPCTNYDASSMTGIAFDAKGSGQIRLEVCMSDLISGNYVDCHGANINISSTWTRYTVRWSGLSQRNLPSNPQIAFNSARVRKIQIMSMVQDYNFVIDNLAFINN